MDEYDALRRLILSERESEGATIAPEDPPRKRKVGKYQREYGRQYRQLRSKHPRMAHLSLTQKAHRATKRIMKS